MYLKSWKVILKIKDVSVVPDKKKVRAGVMNALLQ